ncbi:MAG: radical SAM protein [bacterium]
MTKKLNPIKQIVDALIAQQPQTQTEILAIKRQLAKQQKTKLVTNSQLLAVLPKSPAGLVLKRLLRKRAIRTMSGIAPVAVLTKPFACPGQCAYCPTEKNVPQSYLSNEPAVMRAIHCHYNPAKQVAYRLQALEANGHEPTKIELIVIGGTWSSFPAKYKYWYIASCLAAANRYGQPGSVKLLPLSSSLQTLQTWLKREQDKNTKTKYHIIGLTLETRPDYINPVELEQMRELGCTRVEIGVQAIDDEILKLNKRGSTVADIIKATKLLKDYGFKVTYHFMPALPGSSPQKDLRMFKNMFTPLKQLATVSFSPDKINHLKLKKLIKQPVINNNFNPDQIKFYPTVVTKGSLLYRWWRQGKYKPYTDQALRQLIIKCKAIIPPFVRVIRLIRDIPGESIMAGNKITNLRQIMQSQGLVCQCIRCREAKDQKFKLAGLKLMVRKYQASQGSEYFISFESQDQATLYGFARLRLSQDQPNKLQGYALLRELHVYGELVSVGQPGTTQHVGLGKRLMAIAEQIALCRR